MQPDMPQAGAEVILGRQVISAPQMPLGTAVLIDPRAVHIGVDLNGYARILMEAHAASAQVGLLIVSKFDIACALPASLVTVTGIA